MTGQLQDDTIERLLRELTPLALSAVVRRFHDFAAAEDAVQEASLDAALQWPRAGLPDNPRAWLTQVAFRRMTASDFSQKPCPLAISPKQCYISDMDGQEQETRITIRIPAEIAEQLRHLAKAHDRSLNGEIVRALREYSQKHDTNQDEKHGNMHE